MKIRSCLGGVIFLGEATRDVWERAQRESRVARGVKRADRISVAVGPSLKPWKRVTGRCEAVTNLHLPQSRTTRAVGREWFCGSGLLPVI